MEKEKDVMDDYFIGSVMGLINSDATPKQVEKQVGQLLSVIKSETPVTDFLLKNFRHFNAAATINAAKGYQKVLMEGGKMCVSLAGAMSTGELGISLAQMIREDKVHAISTTGANLEEDVFNLVAHSHYVMLPDYRELSRKDEDNLVKKHLNRVTDTCIPEKKAMGVIEKYIIDLWKSAQEKNMSYFPHEYLYQLLLSGDLKQYYDIDPKNSWMLAAAEKNLPIVCPGWEDSSLGNIFASCVLTGDLKSSTVKMGIDAMVWWLHKYIELSKGAGIGYFQIGGGIAGDFAICVVPCWKLDLKKPETPYWNYFCQISDAVTSYGGYSGATPNEKQTWQKLDMTTPRYIIESDASVIAPLIFAILLGK